MKLTRREVHPTLHEKREDCDPNDRDVCIYCAVRGCEGDCRKASNVKARLTGRE